MSSQDRLEQRLTAAQTRWNLLHERIKKVQHQRDHETRVDEQARLDEVLSGLAVQRQEIEQELESLEGQAATLKHQGAQEKVRSLVLEAREHERKQSFDSALACWRSLALLAPSGYDVTSELVRLQERKVRSESRAQLLRRLSSHLGSITPVFRSVAEFLRQTEPADADPALTLVEQLAENHIDAATFVRLWQELQPAKAAPAPSFDFSASYRRLTRGELALFLGADLSNQFDAAQPTMRRIAAELASEAQLQDSTPGAAAIPLSSVAEYFHMAPEHGPLALLRGVYGRLPRAAITNPLYELLARQDAPLLILCAGQDTQLESAFMRASKPFVVISSVVSTMAGSYPGQILLRYSDQETVDEPLLGDHLSKLSLLEKGYSILFKLRGTCPPPERIGERSLASLVLSERSHFQLAHYVDKIVPTYLSAKLGSLGLWFLGFAPDQWEDRLLSGAVLDSRRSPEPACAVRLEPSRLEAAYWASRGVRVAPFLLPDFVSRLMGASR